MVCALVSLENTVQGLFDRDELVRLLQRRVIEGVLTGRLLVVFVVAIRDIVIIARLPVFEAHPTLLYFVECGALILGIIFIKVLVVVIIAVTLKALRDVLLVVLESLEPLLVNPTGELGDVFRDLGQLLLDELGHLASWHAEDGQQTKDYAANLELEFEVVHKL